MTTDQSKQPEFATTPDANRMTFAHWCREIGWRHLVGVLALIFAAIPVLYILSASLNPQGTLR